MHDTEAFLGTLPRRRKRRLTVLRQFFRFARDRKIILADPTWDLAAREPRGFTGQIVPLDKQRQLFRRWTVGQEPMGALMCLPGAARYSAARPAGR